MAKIKPLLEDFIKSVAPPDTGGPLRELQGRYEDRQREQLKGMSLPFNLPRDSTEFLVEMRIREWVRRMEKERAELERRRKEAANKPPPPPKTPCG